MPMRATGKRAKYRARARSPSILAGFRSTEGLRALSRFAVRGPCPLGRGRALAYRSAPHHLESLASDAAGQRLARNPLPRATRSPFVHRGHPIPSIGVAFLSLFHPGTSNAE